MNIKKCILPAQKLPNFLKLPQTENGKLNFSPTFQKIELRNSTFFFKNETRSCYAKVEDLRAGAGREMAGPPTSPFGRAPPHPHSSPACISRFLYPSIAQLVALSHCYFFLVFDSMTSIMAPAHPYLTGVAMYPAFFQ